MKRERERGEILSEIDQIGHVFLLVVNCLGFDLVCINLENVGFQCMTWEVYLVVSSRGLFVCLGLWKSKRMNCGVISALNATAGALTWTFGWGAMFKWTSQFHGGFLRNNHKKKSFYLTVIQKPLIKISKLIIQKYRTCSVRTLV